MCSFVRPYKICSIVATPLLGPSYSGLDLTSLKTDEKKLEIKVEIES